MKVMDEYHGPYEVPTSHRWKFFLWWFTKYLIYAENPIFTSF